jgi:hypothetical protein
MKEKLEMFLIPSFSTKCIIRADDEVLLYFKEAPGKALEIVAEFICDPFYKPLSLAFITLHEELETYESHVLSHKNFEPRPFRDFSQYQLPKTEKMAKFVNKIVESHSENPLSSFSLKESEFVGQANARNRGRLSTCGHSTPWTS